MRTSQAVKVGDATDINRLKIHIIVLGRALCNYKLVAIFEGENGDATCSHCLAFRSQIVKEAK